VQPASLYQALLSQLRHSQTPHCMSLGFCRFVLWGQVVVSTVSFG
jgi:hypothetical protein